MKLTLTPTGQIIGQVVTDGTNGIDFRSKGLVIFTDDDKVNIAIDASNEELKDSWVNVTLTLAEAQVLSDLLKTAMEYERNRE